MCGSDEVIMTVYILKTVCLFVCVFGAQRSCPGTH